MRKKDCYAILGLLLTECGMVFVEGQKIPTLLLNETLKENNWLAINIIDYLKRIRMTFTFLSDILTGNYGSVFYHNSFDKLPKKYKKEDLDYSEYDYVQIDETGRIGIWCEVDGFVAWLDEYKKFWVVDTRKEVKRKQQEAEEKFKKEFAPFLDKMIEEVMSQKNEPRDEPKFDRNKKYYYWNEDIDTFSVSGLADYKRKGDK